MIVCLCHAVSDKTLDRVLASGCRTAAEVRKQCGAGGDCAACVPEIMKKLRSRRDQRMERIPVCLDALVAAK